jgi:hypothetical protein
MITVKTRNPIRTVNSNVRANASFSYAFGDKIIDKITNKISKEEGGEDEKGKDDEKGKEKKAKTGYFSKDRKAARKDDRIKTREERRAKRIAKYGARPLIGMLKAGKKNFKDRLPKLKKKANGDFEKTLPDGTIVDVPKEQVQILPPPAGAPAGTPPIAVEKAELKTGGQIATEKVNGEVIVTNTYAETQTEKAVDDKGQEQVYKKADVVEEGSKDAKKPMSTLVKVGLGVGAAAVLGVIIYLVVRPKK